MKLQSKYMVFQSAAIALVILAGLFVMNSRRRPSKPPETPVDKYQRSWEHKALKSQRNLDLNVPMKDALFVYTHNTYNSKAYRTAVRYLDPNHTYSIKDQLRMDVRAIELDVHYYFSMKGWPWEWGKKPLLCHGQGNHLGCSSYDRHLSEGIDEINSWIRSNRSEVLISYIEEHMDNKKQDAINVIKSRLGDLIYRPSGGCKDLPINMSKQQILNAGKNIILTGAGCDHSDYGKWVFKFSKVKSGGDIRNYPSCSTGANRNDYNNNLVRHWEDLTTLSAWFGSPGQKTTPTNMSYMVRCGVNLPGTDKLTPTDGRLAAAVWSWDRNEPNNWGGNEDCASQWGNGRWNDANCNNRYRFACKDSSGNWYVTRGTGPWTSGQSTCARERSGGRFEAPANGYENELLKAAKGGGTVWVKFSDRAREGTFVK